MRIMDRMHAASQQPARGQRVSAGRDIRSARLLLRTIAADQNGAPARRSRPDSPADERTRCAPHGTVCGDSGRKVNMHQGAREGPSSFGISSAPA
jgi:hypothetical protein